MFGYVSEIMLFEESRKRLELCELRTRPCCECIAVALIFTDGICRVGLFTWSPSHKYRPKLQLLGLSS